MLAAGVLLAMQATAETDVPLSAADQAAARARDALLLSVAESTDLPGLRIVIAQSQLLSREYAPTSIDPALTDRWQALRKRTFAEGADDPMVQAAVINARGSDFPEADRSHAVAVLTDASHDNGYYGLSLLWLPSVRQDSAATQRLLHVMAEATSFHSSFTPMLRSYEAAAAPLDWRVGMPAWTLGKAQPELSYRVQGIALLAAMGVSGLQPLYAACEHAEGEVRTDCTTIARHWFADADTLIDRNFAIALWSRTCGSDIECASVRIERRKLAWLGQNAMALLVPAETAMSPVLTNYLERMSAIGEISAMKELVAAHGLPLEPPADWRSPWEAEEMTSGPAKQAD